FSKEQIRTVSNMHETFARLTTTSLSAQLRTLVHVHVASVDQLTYEEFIRSIPTPTTLAVINMDPLKGNAVLEIAPEITFIMIDRLFGGSGDTGGKVNRDLTDIEQSVMEGIIVRILANMREAWTQVIDLRPRLQQIETNPQFAQIVPPTEMVILVTLEIKIGEEAGMMNICIPYITIEPIISKLSSQFWFSSVRRSSTTQYLGTLKEKLSDVEMELIAEIGSMNVPIRDVVNLQVGDVIRFNTTKVDDPLVLSVGSRKKFYCQPGVVGKQRAVQIIEKIKENDEDEFEELTAEGDDTL
ncbi:MAG: flagellar motor switch protein FliM, partial [Treponema sp.]|nr:flagellar motor switch protein FliM [Treponema sp.]